jgi:CRP/FNR family transcriptional regulator
VEDDAEILFLPVDRMLDLGRHHPQWVEYLFRMYHRRFEELLDMVNAIAFQKMDERLWNLLNKKSEMQKARILYITHEQLANELGTARVVVSRLLKELETEGKLTLARNKIRLVGPSGLG